MSLQISEYEGERLLYMEEDAKSVSVSDQYRSMEERITKVLNDRGIAPTPWHFRQGAYRHGGILHLTMTYYLAKHTRTPLAQ